MPKTRGKKPKSRSSTGRQRTPWSVVSPGEISAFKDKYSLSYSEIARRLNVSAKSVMNWVDDKFTADLDTQKKIRAMIRKPLAQPPVLPSVKDQSDSLTIRVVEREPDLTGQGSAVESAVMADAEEVTKTATLRNLALRYAQQYPSRLDELPRWLADVRKALNGNLP